MTFAWDSPTGEIGDVSEFTEKEFTLEDNAVLTATTVHKPKRLNELLEVKILETDSEWSTLIDIQTESADYTHLSKDAWRGHYTKQAPRYRAMQKAGRGDWFGGFLNGKLVAGLGIFHEDGLGRYQLVSTHPDYRRQGICGTLVYHSAQHAFKHYGVSKLVMCADPGYFAIDIYKSVGFKHEVTEHGVGWWDRSRG